MAAAATAYARHKEMHLNTAQACQVAESTGCWDPEAHKVLKHIAHAAAACLGSDPAEMLALFLQVCFAVLIYYSCLFWLKLCIYVGHWESCWECTVVAFVTEAAMFDFGKNRVWYQDLWNSALPQPAALKNCASTSQKGPSMWCFQRFYFQMCFAPQRRALFHHLNFQNWSQREVFSTFWLPHVLRATTACTFSSKWPDTEVICTFWLRHVLRTTTACTFSSSQLPKMVRHVGILYIFTSKVAPCHNGVHFFFVWRGTSWHSDVFCNVSKVVLCGGRNTFATFSQDELQFSWQAQHFGCVHRHFAWHAQHFRRVVFLLHTPHFALHTSTLHTLHSTLHTPHSTLWTPHFTLHTLHSTLHTLHSTLRTRHMTLRTPYFTLHTPHSTLYNGGLIILGFFFDQV